MKSPPSTYLSPDTSGSRTRSHACCVIFPVGSNFEMERPRRQSLPPTAASTSSVRSARVISISSFTSRSRRAGSLIRCRYGARSWTSFIFSACRSTTAVPNASSGSASSAARAAVISASSESDSLNGTLAGAGPTGRFATGGTAPEATPPPRLPIGGAPPGMGAGATPGAGGTENATGPPRLPIGGAPDAAAGFDVSVRAPASRVRPHFPQRGTRPSTSCNSGRYRRGMRASGS